MITAVKLDRRLGALAAADAEAWQSWFIRYDVDWWREINYPSEIIWNTRTRALEFQIKAIDARGVEVVPLIIRLPRGQDPLPFPPGYRIETREKR